MAGPIWKPTWNLSRSYDWNYIHGPDLDDKFPESVPLQPVSFLSWQLRSSLGVAAGPLINSRFVQEYARLGYSVLTYKTVRSCEHPAHPAPVLAQVEYTGYVHPLSSKPLVAHSEPGIALPANLSSANSVGLPSVAPELWREDVKQARASLGPGQILIVSVVGTSENNQTIKELADDFAQCAYWAAEAGADMIEVNLSCPNVHGEESDLYLDPDGAACALQTVRASLGSAKVSAKLGYYADRSLMFAVLEKIVPFVDALTLINAVKFPIINSSGTPYFPRSDRVNAGVGGSAIRLLAQENIRTALEFLRRRNLSIPVIAVGGVTEPHHVDEYITLGASLVEVATTAIWQPFFSYNYAYAQGRASL